MRFNRGSSVAAFAAVLGTASAQGVLPASMVPNVGGGVFQNNDPSLSNYTFEYTEPFDPSTYGGYYNWAVSNDTVVIYNVTASGDPGLNADLGNVNTKYPFFVINEATPKAITPSGVGKFKKILHIMFENEVFSWTMNDTYWKLLATRGKLLTNSHGVTHPSLPNYAAIVAGDFFGAAAEDWYNYNTTTIWDLLDLAGIDYATYAEWYTPLATARGPNDCNNYPFPGPLDGTNLDWSGPVYRRLDVPPLLFSTYTSNYTRCSKIYNATAQFDTDVFSHNLPPYSFYAPDMLHNAHDPESDSDYAHQPTTGGIWFNAFLDLYLPALTAQGTLVVATFDEATWPNDSDSIPNNDNHIATLLFGAGITPNTTDDSYITHYGVLRGSITNFGLGSLGRNDTNATNGDLTKFVS
ncbi:hypothetical protein V1509DRAFT_144733 [Lipomyces kononenkoae]